jgi:hypothetical protein
MWMAAATGRLRQNAFGQPGKQAFAADGGWYDPGPAAAETRTLAGHEPMDYKEVATHISSQAGVSLRPASRDDLRTFAELGAPEAVLVFYREYEPEVEVELGHVRLWPITDIVVENTEAVPGADLHPHGFVTFATTIYGDAFCFDTGAAANKSDAPVVIMTHEVIFEDLEREVIMSARKRVASGFDDFLSQFVNEALDLKPNYPGRG